MLYKFSIRVNRGTLKLETNSDPNLTVNPTVNLILTLIVNLTLTLTLTLSLKAKLTILYAAHYRIDFLDNAYTVQNTVPIANKIIFSVTEQWVTIDYEILNFLEKGLVETCVLETGEFVSTFFLRLNKDGN